jgi:hypothetical protein
VFEGREGSLYQGQVAARGVTGGLDDDGQCDERGEDQDGALVYGRETYTDGAGYEGGLRVTWLHAARDGRARRDGPGEGAGDAAAGRFKLERAGYGYVTRPRD